MASIDIPIAVARKSMGTAKPNNRPNKILFVDSAQPLRDQSRQTSKVTPQSHHT
jgi:hypothetical protein